MNPSDAQEHRLAVMTAWGFLGSFGFCFVLSGFSDNDPVAGLAGFAILVGTFIAHVVINRIFGTGFTPAQVALGLTAFVGAILSFIASCLVDPGFGETDILVGLAGFGAIAGCFLVYVMINYGVRGGYALVHRTPLRERPQP